MVDTKPVKLNKQDEEQIVTFILYVAEHRPGDLTFNRYTTKDELTGLEIWTDYTIFVRRPFETEYFSWWASNRIRRAFKKVYITRPYRGREPTEAVLSKDAVFNGKLITTA